MQDLLPGYLIIGPDEVKRDAAIARMKERLAASGMADFNLDERTAPKEEEAEGILGSLNTLPMGSDFRLVILRECENVPKAVSEMLVGYFANPSPSTVCLIQAKTLAKTTRLYKAVSKHGQKALVDCSAKKPRELPALIQQMAARYGASIEPSAAQALIARSGENTRTLDSNLKRLAALAGEAPISRSLVEETVARTASIKPWELTDAIANRDLALSLKLFKLMPEKDHVFIFTLVCARLRELIKAKANETRRGNLAELLNLPKNMTWKTKDYQRWAHKFDSAELEDLLCAAADVELALKGSRDSTTALTLWISQICTSRDNRSSKQEYLQPQRARW